MLAIAADFRSRFIEVIVAARRSAAVAVVGIALCAPEASASDPLERLKEGNERFVEGNCQHPNLDAQRRSRTAERGQHPFATVLSCSDSRVAVERIFDVGVGDLFVIRVAGNVAAEDEIGTIEYGAGHLHTPLLVVMGHSACGAVNAAVSGAELPGELPHLIANVKPAVADARRLAGAAGAGSLLNKAIECNVFHSIGEVIRRSDEIRHLVKDRKLRIIGAVYDLESGKVNWLGPHPEQARLLGPAHGDSHGSARQGESDGHAKHSEGHTAADDHAAEQPHGSETRVAGHQESAAPPSAHHDEDKPSLPAPETVLTFLKEGNTRFAAGLCIHPRSDAAQRKRIAKGQHPIATILTCSDSRLPVERVFDHGLGDVFTVRVAGNVADTNEIASIEYATGHLETPLLIVLGHTACGAVTAVVKESEVGGSIPKLVDNIRPAAEKAKKISPSLSGDSLIAAAIKANVWQSIEDLLKRSPAVRQRAAEGKLMVVGGVYDLSSGRIEWIGAHPEQTGLLGGRTGAVQTSESDD